MAPPISKTLMNRPYRTLVLAYLFYKFVRALVAIRRLRRKEHRQVINSRRLSVPDPSPHLFPQYFKNNKGLWIYHRDWYIDPPNGNNGSGGGKNSNNLDRGGPSSSPKGSPHSSIGSSGHGSSSHDGDGTSSSSHHKRAHSDIRGVVIICHGLAEHIGRYEHVAQFLNQNGFACYGIDHAGHGNSDGDRGHTPSLNDLIDDFILFSRRIRLEYPDSPLFLFAHSLGGLIGTYAALRTHEENLFNGGVILSSPAFGSNKDVKPDISNPFIRSVFETLASFLPKLPVVELNNKVLSHDMSLYYRVIHDPLHFRGKCTAQMGFSIVKGIDNLMNSFLKSVQFPFLLIGGSEESLCDPLKWKEFYSRCATPVEFKEIKIFQGLYHESFNETESASRQVCAFFLEWILKRCKLNES